MAILTIIGVVLYSNELIEMRIVRFNTNDTYLDDYFQWTVTEVEPKVVYPLIQTAIVNFFTAMFILILNTFTLLELKNTLNREQLSTQSRTIQLVNDKVKNDTYLNTKMLVWASLYVIVSNFVFFFISISILVNFPHFYNACVEITGNILYYSHFSFSFLFYYAFNVNFRKELSMKTISDTNSQTDSTHTGKLIMPSNEIQYDNLIDM